jgi:hypothetical protein
MFETLCEGKPSSSSSSKARPKRRLPEMTIRRGQNDHGWGKDGGDDGMGDASVTKTTTNGYHTYTYNDETTCITIYSII